MKSKTLAFVAPKGICTFKYYRENSKEKKYLEYIIILENKKHIAKFDLCTCFDYILDLMAASTSTLEGSKRRQQQARIALSYLNGYLKEEELDS